ncbi:hypothetical protein BH11PSE5_BH11PSE5_16500 [soil metagenome]
MSSNPFAAWPKGVEDGLESGKMNGCVGSLLLSETPKVRVWHLYIPVGARFGFHRHVLNYFWTSLNAGRSRNYFEDGRISEAVLYKGQTQHYEFSLGKYMVHSVENIGETDISFTTVEFLDSPNQALPIPDGMRMKIPA